jgi:hypothetical protein
MLHSSDLRLVSIIGKIKLLVHGEPPQGILVGRPALKTSKQVAVDFYSLAEKLTKLKHFPWVSGK